MLKLLIAYDGSDCANSAVDDLARAGLPAADAVVLSVADVWPHLAQQTYETLTNDQLAALPQAVRRAKMLARQSLHDARVTAEAGAARLRKLFPEWSVQPAARGDTPYNGILRLADEIKPDLIVIGSHGRGTLGRFALGSVSSNVSAHAHCSVRICRPRKQPALGPIKLLVAIDGSANSQAAVSAIAGRTWPAETMVYVLSVLDVQIATVLPTLDIPAGGVGPSAAIASADAGDERDAVQRDVDQAARQLRARNLEVVELVRDGDPRQVIVSESDSWNVDCIFLGARGMSNLERFFLGSVSSAVANRAHCPVEIVRT